MEIKISESCLTTLFFADGHVIEANCEEDIEYILRKLQQYYEIWGINRNMKKYLRIGKK